MGKPHFVPVLCTAQASLIGRLQRMSNEYDYQGEEVFGDHGHQRRHGAPGGRQEDPPVLREGIQRGHQGINLTPDLLIPVM